MLDDETLTIYEIAFHLHIPVYKLLQEMPHDELLCWIMYLEQRPIGWRDDDRTFKLLQAQGYKGKPGSVFTSLAKVYENQKPTEDNIKGLKSSAFFEKLLSAKGGDKLSFL